MKWAVILGLMVGLVGCKDAAREKAKMTNPVVYFEIPVRDLERAEKFYGAVFGFQFTRQEIDGNQMSLFPAGAPGAPGAAGALAKGESYRPSADGTRVYFTTAEIDGVLERARQQGGRTVYPKTSIGELGWVAEFLDSEGNRIALHVQP